MNSASARLDNEIGCRCGRWPRQPISSARRPSVNSRINRIAPPNRSPRGATCAVASAQVAPAATRMERRMRDVCKAFGRNAWISDSKFRFCSAESAQAAPPPHFTGMMSLARLAPADHDQAHRLRAGVPPKCATRIALSGTVLPVNAPPCFRSRADPPSRMKNIGTPCLCRMVRSPGASVTIAEVTPRRAGRIAQRFAETVVLVEAVAPPDTRAGANRCGLLRGSRRRGDDKK